ncbi:MAG: hypothetical protein ACK6DY_10250, partial [Acidobacteriota bacterium]
MDLLHRLIANCHDEAGLAALRAAGLAPLAFHSLAKLPPVATHLAPHHTGEHHRTDTRKNSSIAHHQTLIHCV